MRSLYQDIQRYLQLGDRQLDYALAAWCRYKSADGGLVDLLVDHVRSLGEGKKYRDLKEPYFQAVLRGYSWISGYPHHVKAITLASCKHNTVNHPDLVQHLLDANNHITLEVLMDTIEQQKPHELHEPTANNIDH